MEKTMSRNLHYNYIFISSLAAISNTVHGKHDFGSIMSYSSFDEPTMCLLTFRAPTSKMQHTKVATSKAINIPFQSCNLLIAVRGNPPRVAPTRKEKNGPGI